MKNFGFLFIVLTAACTTPTPTAQDVVDKAIAASGTQQITNATASFTFREISYNYKYRDGLYEYKRTQTDTAGNIVVDALTNEGFARYINGTISEVTEEREAAYTSSVNSVIYFVFLPAWLNDAAVFKTYIGLKEIEGKTYHKIKVTFSPEGGGEDYEDVFYYWFDTEDYSMDYLAYSYNEDEGIGQRFRVAYNARKVNGVTIQDYKNLKPAVRGNIELRAMDQAYMDGKLQEVSLIETENMNIVFQPIRR